MKRILVIVAVVLTLTLALSSVTVAMPDVILEPMKYYKDKETDREVCSLCAGTSIGQYYKDEYEGLPDDADMYDSLDVYMDTGTTSGESDKYVNPIDYGPGFVEMALHYGYDNFSYYHYESVYSYHYYIIMNAINQGWPVALTATGKYEGFTGVPALDKDGDGPWPAGKRHWIAIRGYTYYDPMFPGDPRVVICTDSLSRSDKLYLSWDDIIANVGSAHLEAIIIKDVDTENDGYVEGFEWGTNGESLNDWQDSGGEVDWYASACRSWRRVEIDNAQKRTGSVSALFYRGSSSPYAYYDLFEPSYIQFWVRKDGAAYAEFRNGNGSKYIRVRINSAEQLQYYAPDGWHTVYTVSPYSWYWIGFWSINWGAGTYKIFVCNANGDLITYYLGAAMRSGSSYNGRLYFGSWSGSGTFWIDDIWDSLR